jgi:hypothetical protein
MLPRENRGKGKAERRLIEYWKETMEDSETDDVRKVAVLSCQGDILACEM